MAQILCLSVTWLIFATTLIALSIAGNCPQDPMACIQSVNNKINGDKNDDLSESEQSKNDAAPSKFRTIASNDTFCVDTSSGGNDTMEVVNSKHSLPCKKCTVCPKGAVELRQCNSTQDAVCVCEKGDYFSALTYECKTCNPCPHGYGVARLCTRNRNTVCRQCPPGTFSGMSAGTLSGMLGCILCTSCRPDQVMLQECSRIQDTVCIGK